MAVKVKGVDIAKAKTVGGEVLSASKGLWQKMTKSTSELPARISTAVVSLPKAVKVVGTGTALTVMGSYGIGFAGNKIGGALESMGLKTQTGADQLRDEADAMRTMLKVAEEYQKTFGTKTYNPDIFFGRFSPTDDGNNFLSNTRTNTSGNTGVSTQQTSGNLMTTLYGFLTVGALAGAGYLAFKYANKKVK